MAIKLTVNDLLAAKAAIARMVGLKMPGRAGYWLARLDAKLTPEWRVVEEKRMELVQKHGETDDKGTTKVPPEKLKDFIAEYNVIGGESIEVDLQPIWLSVLADCEIPVGDMMAIEMFIKEDPPNV